MPAKAILICNSTYAEDPARLPELKGPQADVLHLWAALGDHTTGIFSRSDIWSVLERDSSQIKHSAELFFRQAGEEDTLLFYYSGHGYRTPQELFLCGRDTNTELILSTAVGSSVLKRMIDNCLARRIIVLLDCCYAGAFKSDESPARDLVGEGTVVLAAAGPLERVQDAEEASSPSPFTGALCTALLSGAEDLDGDGNVDLDEVISSMRLILKRSGLGIYPHIEGDIGPTVVARRGMQGAAAGVGRIAGSQSPETVQATLRKLSLMPYPDDARELSSKDPDLVLAVLREMPIRQAAHMVARFSRALTAWLITNMNPRYASFLLEELAHDSFSGIGRNSNHLDLLLELDEEDAVSLVNSLAPSAAALLMSETPTPLAAQIIAKINDDAALSILGEMLEVPSLAQILQSLPSIYTVRLLATDDRRAQARPLLENLPPKIAANLLKENYFREDAVNLLVGMWVKKNYILDHLDIEWFCEVAGRLSDDRLAELLEYRSPLAKEFLTTRVPARQAGKLLTLMEPRQANWLLDDVSNEDRVRLFRELNLTERVIFYVIDPVRYDYVTEALEDGPGMDWQQDEATLLKFAKLLAAAEPGRINSALVAAAGEQAADLLALMPARSAARICSQSDDFSGGNTLEYAFYYMKPVRAARIIEKVSRAWAQECLQYLGSPHAFRIFDKVQKAVAVKILEGMEPEEAAVLLKDGESDRLSEILNWIDADFAEDIRRSIATSTEEE